MNTIPGSWNARRFTLLIGMLLHLLGAAAIPAFHADGPAFTSTADRSYLTHSPWSGDAPGGVHDELDCILCQVSGTVAVPETGAQLLVADAVRRAETPAAQHALPHRPASPARARAPPL
ncbi:MAG TPA: hypothetical protein VK358_15990, partial [Longimicrobium sp.]|nr:hypothetical protein [Longimicrobium sp.]